MKMTRAGCEKIDLSSDFIHLLFTAKYISQQSSAEIHPGQVCSPSQDTRHSFTHSYQSRVPI